MAEVHEQKKIKQEVMSFRGESAYLDTMFLIEMSNDFFLSVRNALWRVKHSKLISTAQKCRCRSPYA